MAAHDGNGIPKYFRGGGSGKIIDGSGNEVAFEFEQTMLTWEVIGRTKTEARSRGRHESTPVIVENEDSNIALSLDFYITTFSGSSAVSPYEAMTQTGQASAWTSTAAGNAYCFKIEMTFNNTGGGGGSQTVTFDYVSKESISISENENFVQGSFSGIAYQNLPTIS